MADSVTPSQRDELLLICLFRFFSVASNIKQVIRLLAPDALITRSLLDWFVTNYTKDNDVEYNFKGRVVNVNSEYKAQLHHYKKRRCDPFCRGRDKFLLKTGVDECPEIETSMRQLCFFRWAIQCNILEYVEEHYEELRSCYEARDRRKNLRKRNTSIQTKADSVKRRRRGDVSQIEEQESVEPSKLQTITVTYYKEPIRVRF